MPEPPWGNRPPRNAYEALSGFWRLGREAAKKHEQVVEAVRDAGHGKTRSQLRGLFEDEFGSRAMPPDPVWVERKLDELEWSPLERARRTTENLWLAGATLARIARSRGIPEDPAWMRPPDDADYRAWGQDDEKTPVEVDPAAVTWLERVLAGSPRRIGEMLALVDVWFDWSGDEGEEGQVAVHLGGQRVGALSSSASERFAPVMQSARELDQRPVTHAQLARATHLRPPYLLVVNVPSEARF
jgi:hypothetical protein